MNFVTKQTTSNHSKPGNSISQNHPSVPQKQNLIQKEKIKIVKSLELNQFLNKRISSKWNNSLRNIHPLLPLLSSQKKKFSLALNALAWSSIARNTNKIQFNHQPDSSPFFQNQQQFGPWKIIKVDEVDSLWQVFDKKLRKKEFAEIKEVEEHSEKCSDLPIQMRLLEEFASSQLSSEESYLEENEIANLRQDLAVARDFNYFYSPPGMVEEFHDSGDEEEEEDNESPNYFYRRGAGGLVEEFFESGDEGEEEEDSFMMEDHDISDNEDNDLVLIDLEFSIPRNNDIVENDGEEEDLEEGAVEGGKVLKSFNCCFSLFTSKELESDTAVRNLENRDKIEFLSSSLPFKNPIKKICSLGETKNEKSSLKKENIDRSLIDLKPKITEKFCNQEKLPKEKKHIIDENEMCLICRKKLMSYGIRSTCYALCEHKFHEDCLLETVVDKWLKDDGKNDMHLACPKCVGILNWREKFDQ